jgi:HAD superfamily hydrolase (TIGR01509 family)
MIRNIIFDLGNVLFSWNPSEYLGKKNYSEKETEVILDDIFRSEEWRHLDNGDISTVEAIEKIASKSTLNKDLITLIFNERMEILYPLDVNINLLPLLKKRGFRLFFLSNFPADLFEIVRKDFSFFQLFDGGIISSHVKLSKPDIRIYKKLLSRYKLNPEESVFFDDLNINILGAREAGMTAIHLDHPGKLSEYIEKCIRNIDN